MNEQGQIKFDQRTVDYINRPADDAWEKAEKLVADSRYTDTHKRQEIKKLFEAAQVELEDRYNGTLGDLDKEVADLQKAATVSFSPSREDAAALLYIRDALRERAKTMTSTEIKTLWEQALERSDLLTARVLMDFGQSFASGEFTLSPAAQVIGGAGQTRHAPLLSTEDYETLKARTIEALMSPAQRDAAKALRINQATRMQIGMARSGALHRLSNFDIRGGKLIDGDKREHRDRLKRVLS